MASQRGLHRNLLLYEYALRRNAQTAFKNNRAKAKGFVSRRTAAIGRCNVKFALISPAPRQHKAACRQFDEQEVDRTGVGVTGLSTVQS
ncbi:hypothetical protein KIN20_000900 [Parelaphostrongylus tenuis]|uniref:Uncharacterized protein n=1 Tax=Parelaphostrongylus tenuis TaxID=148309 RepID=A0AAD5MBW0_PARTN|nr:hypothetical protein KIN20_000900 [Parelaphostrongylus tenuis]